MENFIIIAVGILAALYLYYALFRKRDCGCGEGKNCATHKKKEK